MDKKELIENLVREAHKKGGFNGAWFAPFLRAATGRTAALILSCLRDGLYPSWDAANMDSVRLAEKLGYEFSHEYCCYAVNDLGGTQHEA